MATVHLALDSLQDGNFPLASGHGLIVGMAFSLTGLRAQGFAAATYNGNKVVTIETTDAGWDHDCEPGWYFTNNTVRILRPMTTTQIAVADMMASVEKLHEQLVQWDDDIAYYGPGHPDWQRAFAHDALASCHGHVWATITKTSNTIADRKAYAETLLGGASDGQGGRIVSALGYYEAFTTPRHFRDSYKERAGNQDPPTGKPRFYAWCSIANPTTALNLGSLNRVQYAQNNLPAGLVLGRGATWHDTITA